MNHVFHFIAGLPRSGSTLLANVLAQNPRFHASATSGIQDLMLAVRNHWDQVGAFRAMERAASEAAKKRVLRGILECFHADAPRPVVFDKSRGWLANLEMLEWLLERRVKILAPVRDLRDVLASFEKIWRKASTSRQLSQESAHYAEFQSIEGRCSVWTRGDQPVGVAYNRIKDALHRGYRDRIHFVRFEQLTCDPKTVFCGIYSFLEEAPFEHDFERIEQVTFEDDEAFGMAAGLHSIRAKIEPMPPQWPQLLGEAAAPYAGLELW